jgi:hypothetical protein
VTGVVGLLADPDRRKASTRRCVRSTPTTPRCAGVYWRTGGSYPV